MRFRPDGLAVRDDRAARAGAGWLRPQAGLEEPPQSPRAKRRWQRGERAVRLLCAAESRIDVITLNPTASPAAFAQAAKLLTLAQRLDRPGQPRRAVPRVRRLKATREGRDVILRSSPNLSRNLLK